MAKFVSRYAELGFYVDGVLKKFSNGQYTTNDPKEIAVLEQIGDAVRVDKPQKAEEPQEPKKAKPSAK